MSVFTILSNGKESKGFDWPHQAINHAIETEEEGSICSLLQRSTDSIFQGELIREIPLKISKKQP